jgi:quinol monooxygenase YgiN
MLCALTVRRLKPGSFDEFREKFGPDSDQPPAGWVKFHVLRSLANPDEVVTYGYFDGTMDELEQSQSAEGYDERRAAVEPLVESVVANGVYEIVEVREIGG